MRISGAVGLEGSTPLMGNRSSLVSPVPAGDQLSVNLPSGRVVTPPRKPVKTGDSIPFKVTLYKIFPEEGGAPTYEVTVAWGYVIERIPGYGDPVAYHEPDNMWEKDEEGEVINPKKLARFAITAGQAVYIKCNISADGTITPIEIPPVPPSEEPTEEPAVTITIDEDEKEGLHYEPKVDDETPDGADGFYFYKLVVFKSPEVPEGEEPPDPPLPPKLEKWLTGSHIDHWQDLPSILSTMLPAEGVGCIIKRWDNDARAYKIRAVIKGLGKNTITTEADAVEVRGTKLDAGVFVWYRGIEPSTSLYNWEDGYNMTGTQVIGNEPVPPDPMKLDIIMPVVQELDEDPQVHVSELPQANPKAAVYLVRGNSNDGVLTVTYGEDSPVTVLEWKDGLVTSEPANITIPAPEGDGLPEGSAGDMLYHNGTDWVVLPAPAAPTSEQINILTHDGTAPSWNTKTIVTLGYCEAGTPTTGDFIKL